LTGTGPGTFEVSFTRYQPPGIGVLINHAHNDYLEFISDIGIGAIPIMIWMLFLFFRNGFRNQSNPSRQTRGFSLACMTAAVAILVHSFGDFNLRVPSNALLFTVIAGLLTLPKQEGVSQTPQ
jgi:O-antigen ligase